MMKLKSVYPVILTSRLTETKTFYCRHFDFESTFEADWYVSLATPTDPPMELALLEPGHASLPVDMTGETRSLLLNFEVADVAVVHERLIGRERLPVLLGLRDEPWGQRHFITRDPNGILIDVIQAIPPSPEFQARYCPAALRPA